MIGILKYKAGNTASVSNALQRLKSEYVITDETEQLDQCDGIVFPGVGHAASAMNDLRFKNLDDWLKNTDKPILGICLGMQLMFDSTEEGDCETLGLIPGRLKKFDKLAAKVPHMGWNQLDQLKEHPILGGIGKNQSLYYVHSYYAPVNEYTIASCTYIKPFAAVVARNNYIGVQFHPEKSGQVGSLLLENFLGFIQQKLSKKNKIKGIS